MERKRQIKSCRLCGVFLFLLAAFILCGGRAGAQAKTYKLGKGSITAAKKSIVVKKNKKTVTIKKSGSYTLSGKIQDYRIVMRKENLKVTLALKNVTATNNKYPCIYNSKKSAALTISAAKGTVSHLTGPTAFAAAAGGKADPDAVIFSDGNLTLAGSGSVYVNDRSGNGDAIGSKKSITLKSGSYNATSKASSLQGDNIYVKGGSLAGNSQDTSVKASGKVTVTGGVLRLSAVDKGIQGKAGVIIKKGTINVTTTKREGAGFEDFRGITAGVSGANGKKAVAGSIWISGGNITVKSYGDCIHAANNVTINGGTFHLTSDDDDGIQAKQTLVITGSARLTIAAKGKKIKGGVENIAPSVKY